MPFATYALDSSIADNIKSLNTENINKFIQYIELLNLKKRAILIDEDNNVLEKITKKYFDLSKELESVEEHILSETIITMMKVLNDSILCKLPKNNKLNIKIDFKKNLDNQFDKKLYSKYNQDAYDASAFESSVKIFEKDFLEKIKTFIVSKNIETKKINTLHIFHKELANYLLPWKDNERGDRTFLLDQEIESSLKDPLVGSKYDRKKKEFKRSFYTENVAKINGGTKVLFNWWKDLTDTIRPEKFIIHTEAPWMPYSSKQKTKQIFEEFLFNDRNKFDAKVNFLDSRDLPKQWWKHKRHFVFGKEILLLIWSEFGVEFVDEKDNSQLNKKNKFIFLGDNIEIEHRKEIKEITKKYA